MTSAALAEVCLLLALRFFLRRILERERGGAVTEWFRPCGGWGVAPCPRPIAGPAGGRGGPGPRRPQGLRADMAAPAYPGWVTRWVSGQWRNKKRPPSLRPPRTLALADKVANRRERGTGELPAARGRPGPAGPRCRQSSALPCAPQGQRGGAGPGRAVEFAPRSVGRSLSSHCSPEFVSYVGQTRRVLAFALTLKIQPDAVWLQGFA